MYSNLIGFDTDNCSPDKAIATVMAEVQRLVRDEGLSLSAAWARVKVTEPELCAKILAEPPPASALENGDGTPQPPALSVLLAQKPFVAGAFHLPVNVNNDVLEKAWRANGSQFASVDANKVFMAVHMCVMKKTGLSASDARRQMIDDYPELTQFAGQMPSQQAGATGPFGIKF